MFLRSRNRFELGALARPSCEAPKAKLGLMNMLKNLLSTFELPPAPPASTDADRDRLAREIVAERSHGNILLQQGKYYTKEDMDAECEQVLRYDFKSTTKQLR